MIVTGRRPQGMLMSDRNIDNLPNAGKDTTIRLKRVNNYIALCDKNGNVIPRQTSLRIHCQAGEPIEVTMTAYIYPEEIEDDLLKGFEFTVLQKEKL